MKHGRLWGVAAAVFVAALATASIGATGAAGINIAIQVAPATLLLGADQGGSVTVHTDIARSIVNGSTVKLVVGLKTIDARAVFADSTGNLVAKFPEQDVKAVVRPSTATLTLIGMTQDRTPFQGSTVVAVRIRK